MIVRAFLLAAMLSGAALRADETVAADVCVYGATPGGIAAAVSAGKAHAKVVLIEPTERIGGMMTSGLSYSDFRTFEALSGFFWDFARRVWEHYAETYGADPEPAKSSWRGTMGEPKVNLMVFERMLAEQKVRVVSKSALARLEMSPWQMGRRRIVAAIFRDASGGELRVEAKMFIDGSYEGDLMAMAGESYHVGRESRQQYGEPLAGDAEGRADGQVQGYNFRFIMTQVEANKRMPEAPEGYRREDFSGVLDVLKSGRVKKIFSAGHDGIFRAHLPLLPFGKADVNDTPHAPVRLSMPDINDAYPDGDAATRARIVAAHRYYNVGLLYFLQHDPEVPPALRDDARSWGWCRDEFTETGGIPPQLYIREARRMVGQHVFTGSDTRRTPGDARSVLHTDSIAIGDYVHNCHGTGRTGTRFDGEHVGEFYDPVQPYQIPYGTIVPQKTENLLVPVACSASHFGFGALRLEPVWCALGQAAGWAAALAIYGKTSVQDVRVPELQDALHANRSATIYVSDVPPESSSFAAAQWFGTRGGFHGLAEVENPARPKSIIGQYSEAIPGHEAALDQPPPAAVLDKWRSLFFTEKEAPPASAPRREWVRRAYERPPTR